MTEHQVWPTRDAAAGAALVQMLTAAAKELSTPALPALVAAGPLKPDDMGVAFASSASRWARPWREARRCWASSK